MDIIWTKDELRNIKKIILTKISIKVNENNELVRGASTINYNATNNSLYTEVIDELNKLFYMKDREKISEILTKASQIKADPNNKLHYGLVTTLSKINPNKHEEIFIVFKEIIAQYEKSINNIVTKIANSSDNIDELKEIIKNINNTSEMQELEKLNKINEIINNNELTTKEKLNNIKEISNTKSLSQEEKLIKKDIESVFVFCNGVTEDKLFTDLIEKLDNLIKHKLLIRLHQTINRVAKTQDFSNQLGESYARETKVKFEKHNLSKLKKQNKKIFYSR